MPSRHTPTAARCASGRFTPEEPRPMPVTAWGYASRSTRPVVANGMTTSSLVSSTTIVSGLAVGWRPATRLPPSSRPGRRRSPRARLNTATALMSYQRLDLRERDSPEESRSGASVPLTCRFRASFSTSAVAGLSVGSRACTPDTPPGLWQLGRFPRSQTCRAGAPEPLASPLMLSQRRLRARKKYDPVIRVQVRQSEQLP